MNKNVKTLIAMIMLTLLFACNVTNASAATIAPISSERTVLSEGYTEDGVHYTVYLSSPKQDSGVTPNYVVSYQYTIDVQFDGKITPPYSWTVSFHDDDLNTDMSGTLYCEYWYYENFFGWTTYATYKGYVFGHL